MTPSTRIVIVGGGILGTMHAVEAVRRGYDVVQLERDLAPRGASVRNFGLIWVSGRAPGPELELALVARRRWEEIAADVPEMGFRPLGSLTVARSAHEYAVLESLTGSPDAEQRGLALLDPPAARAANPALCGELVGALFCEHDAAVEPRLALGALRAFLECSGAYRFLPDTEAQKIDGQSVIDQRGERYSGDLIVFCTGAATGGPLGEWLSNAPLRRVRLQMLETKPFDGEVKTAIADGDCLRYYPAFAPYREKLATQDDLGARWRSQLLMVHRLAGHLTIGDTHAYEEPFPFDVDDAPSRHLIGVAEALLGRKLPAIERRWAGVYCESTDPGAIYYRSEIAPGVVVVTGPGGRGMTMSPAIAMETFE